MTRKVAPSYPPLRILDRAMRGMFHLVCGNCGSGVHVEVDFMGHHVPCRNCSATLQVVRSAHHVCEHCGARVSADLTAGSTVAACEQCGRPYMVGTVTAPVVKRYRHRRVCPPGPGRQGGGDGIGVIMMAAVVLLSTLALLFLVFS